VFSYRRNVGQNMEMWANVCSIKLFLVAKGNENIQPGNAELEGKG
jgi:hypothetical protein